MADSIRRFVFLDLELIQDPSRGGPRTNETIEEYLAEILDDEERGLVEGDCILWMKVFNDPSEAQEFFNHKNPKQLPSHRADSPTQEGDSGPSLNNTLDPREP
jgi:hypothetical protein